MDPATWIAAVTALGGLVKAWIDAKKSGVDLEKAKLEIGNKVSLQAQQEPIEPQEFDPARRSRIVIDQELLARLVEDILAAKRRFAATFNDPRYTPADVDREEDRARLCVCAHLKRIREFNAGTLPNVELESLGISFRCGG